MLDTLSLHQLRCLLVLLEERSVTRAAGRLHVSQPALSHILAGLRTTIGDPLLVPARGGLVPTRRAESLEPALRGALRALEAALAGGAESEPASWRRTVVLATWDAAVVMLLPGMLARIRRDAPHISLDIRPVPPEGASRALEDGQIDVALEVRPAESPGLLSRAVATDGFACVVRRDHSGVGDTLDLETWLSLPHALISPQGGGRSVVDTVLDTMGRQRHVALRIRFFLAAPLLVADSDLVLTAPRSLCEQFARLAPLRILEPPITLPTYTTRMVWHERTDQDPVLRWIRDTMVSRDTSRSSSGSP